MLCSFVSCGGAATFIVPLLSQLDREGLNQSLRPCLKPRPQGLLSYWSQYEKGPRDEVGGKQFLPHSIVLPNSYAFVTLCICIKDRIMGRTAPPQGAHKWSQPGSLCQFDRVRSRVLGAREAIC